MSAAGQDEPVTGKFYRMIDGKVDARTYNGFFRRIARDGTSNGQSIMKGYADDPNITPYIDDIYGYLQARADGVLGRGRPTRDEH
jgi:hypothetical protein